MDRGGARDLGGSSGVGVPETSQKREWRPEKQHNQSQGR